MVVPSVRSCSGTTPFTAPWVATGMNTGVSTTPCAVVSRPSRAPLGSTRTTSKPNGALT